MNGQSKQGIRELSRAAQARIYFAGMFAGCCFLGSIVPAAAVQVSGTYSNLRYIEEAGDLIGEELMIVPQPGGNYSVLVQCAGGGLGLTVLVPAIVVEDQITFDVPKSSDCPGHYVAHFTKVKTGTDVETFLTFPDSFGVDRGPVRLKNKRSYWDGS